MHLICKHVVIRLHLFTYLSFQYFFKIHSLIKYSPASVYIHVLMFAIIHWLLNTMHDERQRNFRIYIFVTSINDDNFNYSNLFDYLTVNIFILQCNLSSVFFQMEAS